MDIKTYRAFLTLENVHNFIIYIIENNLIHDDKYREFFTFVADGGHSRTMENTNKYKCLNNCDYCLSAIPDCFRVCTSFPCLMMFGLMCLPFVPCAHDIDEVMDRYIPEWFVMIANSYLEFCGFCGASFAQLCCCGVCVRHELFRMGKSKTFTSMIRDILYHGNYHEMLLNYPPYADYRVKTWICGFPCVYENKNFDCMDTYEQQVLAHTLKHPIDETYDEHAFVSFFTVPENQIHIVSHVIKFGKKCCVGFNWSAIIYNMMKTNVIRTNVTKHIVNSFVVTILNNMYYDQVAFDLLHTLLLHIIPYREFLHHHQKRKPRLLHLHENVFDNFDANDITNHVFGNEYLVENVCKFL
jgi:hypothetical protein